MSFTESPISTALTFVVNNYATPSGSTLYFYDLLLTFDDEVTFFWNGGGGWLIRTLFLINRYLPIAGSVSSLLGSLGHISSNATCQAVLLIGLASQVVGVVVATAIFCLRACSLYQSMNSTRNIIIVSYWISTIPQVVLAVVIIVWTKSTISATDGSCVLNGVLQPDIALNGVMFFSPLLCEAVIMVAIGRHVLSVRHVMESNSSGVALVLRHLYRDGFLYVISLFGIRLANCLLWNLSAPGPKATGSFLENSITSVLTSRFFLSLRKSITESIIRSDLPTNSTNPTSALITGPTITFDTHFELQSYSRGDKS